MITAPLETFAPAPLLALINGASYWVDISLAVLLAITCVLMAAAVVRRSTRRRWLLAAGAVAFCGFISDEFVYRYYWDGMCAHAGYYQDGARAADIPKLQAFHAPATLSSFTWDNALNVRRYSLIDTPYIEIELLYFGARWYRHLVERPLKGLGATNVFLKCSQHNNGE